MPSEVMDCFTLFAMTGLSMESANALSKALHVPAGRINDIVLERRGVTPDSALRLTDFQSHFVYLWCGAGTK